MKIPIFKANGKSVELSPLEILDYLNVEVTATDGKMEVILDGIKKTV